MVLDSSYRLRDRSIRNPHLLPELRQAIPAEATGHVQRQVTAVIAAPIDKILPWLTLEFRY
jgi:hypothetical protein